MAKNIFSICKSIKTPAQMLPCTPELLNAAMDDQQVCNACREIARRLAEVKEGTLTREAFESLKSQIKADNLPVVCFHATFSDGYRHNQMSTTSASIPARTTLIRWQAAKPSSTSVWLTSPPAARASAWCL